MNVKKKECPSCAMEILSNATVCPICGYEFPAGNKYLSIIVAVLLILMLLYFIL